MFDGPLIIQEALRRSADRLQAVGDNPRLDAELLLQLVLGCSRTWFMAHGDFVLNKPQAEYYAALVNRRYVGEPIAYILKEKEFWSLPLRITPAVLIPRPETEVLVEHALRFLDGLSAPVVLDLGTGSGAIALALLHERSDAKIVAVDKSAAALRIARENARNFGLDDSIDFVESDWFSALRPPARYDLIVCNPPYIAVGDPELEACVIRFEPPEALYSESNGLADLERIIDGSREWLKPGGFLLTEHGSGQDNAVREFLRGNNFSMVRTWNDLSGRPRASGGLFG